MQKLFAVSPNFAEVILMRISSRRRRVITSAKRFNKFLTFLRKLSAHNTLPSRHSQRKTVHHTLVTPYFWIFFHILHSLILFQHSSHTHFGQSLTCAEVVIMRKLLAVSPNFANVFEHGSYCHVELIKHPTVDWQELAHEVRWAGAWKYKQNWHFGCTHNTHTQTHTYNITCTHVDRTYTHTHTHTCASAGYLISAFWFLRARGTATWQKG
jgi:hypothetical protein